MHQRLPHLLQCVEFHNSSFTFAKINSLIAVDFVGGLVHPAFAEQPARIGFLGAGVIFKEGLTVRGLTTAASIWVTAATACPLCVKSRHSDLVEQSEVLQQALDSW